MQGYTNAEKAKIEEERLAETVNALDMDQLPTANIMVAGKTGTGKSTLLNAVFGNDMAKTGCGKPVTAQIDEYQTENIPIRIWDTVGLELDAQKTKESIAAIKRTIASKASSGDRFDRIHAIWYCINFGGHKYEGAELDFVNSLYAIGVPFIIVITQCIGTDEDVNAFEKCIREINESRGMHDIDVVQVCAKEFKVRGFTIPAFGLEQLVDTTIKKMPGFIKSGFIAAQTVSKSQKRIQCEAIICEYVQAAKEGFWDKIPLANIWAANTKVKKMFQQIGTIYNTQIPSEVIDKIIYESGIDWPNCRDGLLNPLKRHYYNKVFALLNSKKKEGFEVSLQSNLSDRERVAVLIAFYGYTFITAIEEVWSVLTDSQLKDIDFVCRNLLDVINRILRQKNKSDYN